MIIVQTPLRVSFFGGGTDFRSFFEAEGGCVLTTAIDKYIFVTIKQRFDHFLRVGYTKTELVEDVADIHHNLVREALHKTGIKHGVEITTMGDIPTEGSGLGSSSTVTVGALHAMYTFDKELISAEQLAKEACEIEIDILGSPIGIQDQYIAAYGGLRFIEFQTNGHVNVQSVHLDRSIMRRFNDGLLLFYTGVTRQANAVLSEQQENIKDRLSVLREMRDMAHTARDLLCQGNLDGFGRMLHESWELKKQLASKISNSYLDDMYMAARKAGAVGGKITGAGGGGFLLLYCPYERQEHVREALHALQELPFNIGQDGSKVIFNYHR
ncbi:MAG: GHMP kinase [Chloroflexi bacterium]|nr:GHMP kinase [Chloroflexota bacterium]MBP8055596.1 GHMP kinase [Chloroflexota bacterium]